MSCFVFILLFLHLTFSSQVASIEKSNKAVFCYYGSWATYRSGIGAFHVENIDTQLCTHIVYTFLGLRNGVVTSLDPYNDFEENWGKGSLRKFTQLAKDNGIKSILAVGGWNEGSVTYSEMAATQERRDKFAGSVVEFLKKYGFDGFDLDWEYPTQRGGSPHDRENYSSLLKNLAGRLHAEGKILSVAVAADPDIASQAYDFAQVGQHADYINLMTFDYHTASADSKTALNSPIEALPHETGRDRILNIKSTLNQWQKEGVPKEKLLLGVPLYGRTYRLADKDKHGLGAPTVGAGAAGQYTQEPGFLAYYEICMNPEWNIFRYSTYVYGYSGYEWVSHEVQDTVAAKAQLIMDEGLGGVMFWALESEDFRNSCSGGANPLMTAVNKVLGRI